uniref:Uncharacterized protein n=2 Tax=Aegilops tauschii subsp. strangulata TaxID=200361 RepID=A0A453K127_AEGTS
MLLQQLCHLLNWQIRPRVIKAPITFSCILSEEERWITLVMLAMLDATGDLLAEDELHWMWSCAGAAERRICGGAVVLMLSSSSRVHTWEKEQPPWSTPGADHAQQDHAQDMAVDQTAAPWGWCL